MELKYYTTTYNDNKKQTTEENHTFVDDMGEENNLINLYPEYKKQTMDGFGGAITDSAGYVYSLLNDEQKKRMADTYFGKDGMHYNHVRIPIDSCDFSLAHYEADSNEADENFDDFSFERVEKYIIPLLDAAEEAYGGKLDIMLSPWSPPVYMKTNGERNNGGKLKDEYRRRWAEYLCRYISEYRNRGYHVTKMTMQNEPKAVQTWDSCVYTAEEERDFIRDYLHPALVAHGLDDIDIYIWDHNKERAYEWAKTIFTGETGDMVAGLAFHWYSGDHFEALQMIRDEFPDKKLLLSEACIEYRKFAADDYLGNAQKYGHDMIGNLNNGMESFFDWNLILDEQGGPNHVGNFCDAPFLYDTHSKVLNESNIAGYIWHFSHFIEAGAVRIGLTRFTDELEATAFEKDGKISVVVLNRTDKEIPFFLRLKDSYVSLVAKPKSIATGLISQ